MKKSLLLQLTIVLLLISTLSGCIVLSDGHHRGGSRGDSGHHRGGGRH